MSADYQGLNNRFVCLWFPELYPAFYFIIKFTSQYKQAQVKQDFPGNQQTCRDTRNLSSCEIKPWNNRYHNEEDT